MFEIATQFNAIFRAQSATRSGGNGTETSVSLLSMWTTRRVLSFLKIVATQLATSIDDSASLRDALDACVFLSSSMGRLGADFTSQLPPLFEQKMLSLVLNQWTDGTTQFAETLKICRDAGVATPLVSSAVVSDNDSSLDSSSSSTAPPRQLMTLPPLGRLVNAFLLGLNELRRCLLPGIFATLRASLEEALRELKNILHAHERAVMTPGLRGDAVQLREIAKEMKGMTKNIVFPYLRGTLELSLGNETGAKEHLDKLKEFLKPPPPLPSPALETSEAGAGDEERKNGTFAENPSPTPAAGGVAFHATSASTTTSTEGQAQTEVEEGWADDGMDVWRTR